MSSFRVRATCVVLCVFSALPLQAQKATCTNWNIWLLNPKNATNPFGQAAGVNDNRTVVGTAAFAPLSMSQLSQPQRRRLQADSMGVALWSAGTFFPEIRSARRTVTASVTDAPRP